jgi:hypothetical protein
MPGLLWLLVGLVIGAGVGFLTCCVLVAAGTDAAKYHDS